MEMLKDKRFWRGAWPYIAGIIICLIGIIFAPGCAGKSCISVGGTYEGVNGNIMYCYEPGQSEKNRVPTFDSGDKNAYLISESDIIAANKMMENNSAKISAASINPGLSEIEKFLAHVRKSK